MVDVQFYNCYANIGVLALPPMNGIRTVITRNSQSRRSCNHIFNGTNVQYVLSVYFMLFLIDISKIKTTVTKSGTVISGHPGMDMNVDPFHEVRGQCHKYVGEQITQEAQLMLTNPREAFIGQSRSPNIVLFHMLGIVSSLCNSNVVFMTYRFSNI